MENEGFESVDKQHLSQSVEALERVFAHGVDVLFVESQNDKVRTARFVLDGLNGTGLMRDVFNVLFRDGQAAFHNARTQRLLLFFGVFSVVKEKHADA